LIDFDKVKFHEPPSVAGATKFERIVSDWRLVRSRIRAWVNKYWSFDGAAGAEDCAQDFPSSGLLSHPAIDFFLEARRSGSTARAAL